MSKLDPRRETERELVYGHAPLGGILGIVAGLAIALLAGTRGQGTAATVALGAGILFAVAGLYALMWRDDLELDLVDRRYRRRRGLWPMEATRTGGFDELEGIALAEDPGHHRGERTVEWDVWLHIRNRDEPRIRIREAQTEEEARAVAQRLADRLEIPVIDHR